MSPEQMAASQGAASSRTASRAARLLWTSETTKTFNGRRIVLHARWDRLNSCCGYFRVMSLAFRVGEAELEGKTLHCGVLELENAVLALFWEGTEPKLGSTTATLPGMA